MLVITADELCVMEISETPVSMSTTPTDSVGDDKCLGVPGTHWGVGGCFGFLPTTDM